MSNPAAPVPTRLDTSFHQVTRLSPPTTCIVTCLREVANLIEQEGIDQSDIGDVTVEFCRAPNDDYLPVIVTLYV